MPITGETTLSRHNDVLYAPVNDEQAVLLCINHGRRCEINATGCRIWELLSTPMTVAQICARLCEEFEIDMPSCEAAVLQFAGEMIDNGIIYDAQTASATGAPRPLTGGALVKP